MSGLLGGVALPALKLALGLFLASHFCILKKQHFFVLLMPAPSSMKTAVSLTAQEFSKTSKIERFKSTFDR